MEPSSAPILGQMTDFHRKIFTSAKKLLVPIQVNGETKQYTSTSYTVPDILPCISAGLARGMVAQPFDAMKTRLQVLGQGSPIAAIVPVTSKYSSTLDCCRKMVLHEGPLSFYRGSAAPLIGSIILWSIHFPVYASVLGMLNQGSDPQAFNVGHTLAAGSAAGAVGSLVSTPAELVRAQMMMRGRTPQHCDAPGPKGLAGPFKNSFQCASHVLRHHGVRGLYQGFRSTMLRDAQGYAWFFCGYEATLHMLARGDEPTALPKHWQVLSAGMVGGLAMCLSMFPIDTIKSKMQADSLAHPTYRSATHCLSSTLAREGVASLWRGFAPALFRIAPVNAALFLAVDAAKTWPTMGAFAQQP